MVRPKKHLGQHFLRDKNIARKIVDALQPGAEQPVLEIGPGTGVLTGMLVEQYPGRLFLVEIDAESVDHLHQAYPALGHHVIQGDFLKLDLQKLFPKSFAIIGNFPYNISSQIFFTVLDHRDRVEQVVCMLQKEVADRLCAKHGSKTYGILSVLLQAFYNLESLFKVSPGAFHPPPKVMSSVIRLTRNARKELPCDELLFRTVVKQSFQKRRKTLRNALKHLNLPDSVDASPLMDKRPEQLSVEDFIHLTQQIEGLERVR
ncbi:MAG: 16S rRNA (adenine(1518)-N(6)/adenine(1519)-N(6))-dimethyltransferase RsmA [Cyclobacteriaceae bacterium]|nr:16S rRNA (adenine(1518)-N(6)/adenine(1519)-N(6))-dimethyltransferase RsmA [Cyclobacteriaceae bacterium]